MPRLPGRLVLGWSVLGLACSCLPAFAAEGDDKAHATQGSAAGVPSAADASSPYIDSSQPTTKTTKEDSQADQPPVVQSDTGFKTETRIVGISQRVNAAGSPDGSAHTRTNFRADVFLTLGAGSIGDANSTISAQLRAGNGRSVGVVPTFSSINSTAFDPADSAPNATVFDPVRGASRTYGTVAQLYYELDMPLGRADPPGTPRPGLKLAIGKLDLFNFFDQNRVSSNENVNFINSAFVHNPLLDAGGDTTSDTYGYQPGLRLAYADVASKLRWGASFGAFAGAEAADFSRVPRRPLLIAQLQAAPRQAQGRPFDNYRVYVWTNGRTSNVGDTAEQRHTGIGFSGDQRLGRDWNFFQRLGQRINGHGGFDTAVTLGGELEGQRWGRSKDAIGLAFGWLRTSAAFQRFTRDNSPPGSVAGGAERITELYYRYRVNEWLQLSPDLQRIERPAGNGGASAITVFGLRARIAF